MRLPGGCVWVGAALGGLCALSPGSVFIGLLVLATLYLLSRWTQQRDRRFVLALFLAGLLLRLTLSVGLDLAAWISEGQAPFLLRQPEATSDLDAVDRTRSSFQMPDSDHFSERGYALAQYARGRENFDLFVYLNNRYGRNAYLYVIGAFYYLFGFAPITVKWINGLLGALLGPLVFFLAGNGFPRPMARWAAVVTAFFPSLVLWSSANLKDPAFTLVTLVILLLCLRIQRDRMPGRDQFLAGIGLSAAVLLHASLRIPVYTVVLLMSWLLALGISALWRRRQVALLALVAALIPIAAGPLLKRGIAHVLWGHVSYAFAQGETYRFLPAPYYSEAGRVSLRGGHLDASAPALLSWGARAVTHYLFQPFPWDVRNAWHLAVYPQMILWCFCLAFAVPGLLWGLSRGGNLLLFLTLCGWIGTGALSNGNVGAVFRFRDMITPLVLIFSSSGAWVFAKGWKEEPK